MVDEGSFTYILSSLSLKYMDSPKLVTIASQLLAYDRRLGESLRIIPNLPITLGGKTILLDVLVDGLLDLNMLFMHDYVYAMNVVVYTLFQVTYFP